MIQAQQIPIIEVDNLVKRFGSFIANDHLTFSVYPGEIFGFLGANGAGKTTTIRILSGLLKPSEGSVSVVGYDALKQAESIKKNIGYMSQRFSLYDDLTVNENIRLFGGIYGLSRKEIKKRTAELINDLGIDELKNRLVGSVPLGWKQKLAFSIAILHRPKLVFLDEPTGGVDPLTRRQFWELIYRVAREGITVFVTTHYMDEAEYCDRICILAEGRIHALGDPSQLKEKYQVNSVDEVFYSIAKGGQL
ncbi:MAG: ABC transporter ATP-binding protein [Bacteroidales bacterium]|nr:ABC transporter ATP-binding protein [Bacteroidales bacterium]